MMKRAAPHGHIVAAEEEEEEEEEAAAAVPANMLTTDSRIFSTLWTGLHLSALLSYPIGSSPGA